MIGDSSTLSGDLAALNAIMVEWTSGNSYDTRVTNLQTQLNNSTVQNDGSTAEKLLGGADNDWFFRSMNDPTRNLDAVFGEILTTI